MARSYILVVVVVIQLICCYDAFKFVNSTYYNSHRLDDARQWCNYTSSTPEPNVIAYNRMPKAGSSTMEYLFNELSSSNKFGRWAAESKFWGDLDEAEFATLRREFEKIVTSKLQNTPSKQIIIDGHWSQTMFKPSKISAERVEYIQLIRDCQSRRKSLFFYGLYDSVEALKVKSDSAKFKQRIREELRIADRNISVEDCLSDYECLKASGKLTYTSNRELKYICGPNCNRTYGSYVEGALKNLHDPEAFTVVGVLDILQRHLGMLECAYPKMLKGILNLFNKNHMFVRVGSRDDTSPALKRLLDEICHRDTNPYIEIYEEAIEVLKYRYHYARKNHNKCCRKA